MSKNRVFLFLMILGTAFWGVSFSFVKAAIGTVSPLVFLTYKFAIAGIALALIFSHHAKRINIATLKIGFYLAIPLILGNIFQTIGLKHTSVTNSAFITGLDVLLIPIFQWLLFKKPVQKKVWIACVCAATGLYFIIAGNSVLSFNLGDFWTLLCAICFAAYVLAVGHYAKKMDTMPTVIVTFFVCSLGCLLAGLLSPGADWLHSSPIFWTGVLFAALLGTAFMYSVQSVAQKHLEAEKIALTYLCEPVFATLFGALWLHESLTRWTFLGGGLILLALFVAESNISGLVSKTKLRRSTSAEAQG